MFFKLAAAAIIASVIVSTAAGEEKNKDDYPTAVVTTESAHSIIPLSRQDMSGGHPSYRAFQYHTMF